MKKEKIYDLFAQKVADITGIPYPYIIQFRDMGMMDQTEVRNILVRYDYWKLYKSQKLTNPQILVKLSGIYGINVQTIKSIIKNRTKKLCYCTQCGDSMPKKKYVLNEGVCDKCIAKTIEL